MYTLYMHPYSQHSRRVVSLMKALDLPVTEVVVDLGAGEHMGADYLAVNPNHQVPTLVDGDIKIHESNAILRYLCLEHGRTDWYPAEPARRAAVEQWLDWNQCRFGPNVGAFVFNTVFAGDAADPDAAMRGRTGLDETLPILETALAGSPYLAGETPTIADLSVASNIFQLGFAKATPETPNLKAWFARINELEAYRDSLPELAAA